MNLYELLKRLNINYDEIEHQAVFTVEDVKKVEYQIEGIGCKNLFLTDRKGAFYLVVLQEDKRANIKELSNFLGGNKLSFAKEEDLNAILNLERGSVTPLGIINDINNKVIIVIDKDLQNEKLLFHPNVNTKTVSIEYKDLIKFIEYLNHKYISYNMGGINVI